MNKKVKGELLEICGRMKSIREAQGLTQYDFAKLVGATRPTISAIEAGYFTPSYTLIKTVHHKLKIPYEYIIDGKSGINPSKDIILVQDQLEKLKEDYDILLTAYKLLKAK